MKEIVPLRELHRREMNCQIIHDAFPARGFSDPYLIRAEGRIARPLVQRFQVLQSSAQSGHRSRLCFRRGPLDFPEFLDGFKKIGYDNITLNEATSLKANGITPAYVSEMRDKGFKSQNLNKYIELKNAFN